MIMTVHEQSSCLKPLGDTRDAVGCSTRCWYNGHIANTLYGASYGTVPTPTRLALVVT